MYDLPSTSNKEKSNSKKFRKNLIKDGFRMMQYSIYARYCFGEENAEMHKRRIKKFLIIDGKVNIIKLTDKQFDSIEMFEGRSGYSTINAPELLMFY